MSVHIHTDYHLDILEKRYCKSCQKAFIVGEELRASVVMVFCPYCLSSNNTVEASCDEDLLAELGCLAICFNKTGNNYYDICILCEERLTEDVVASPGLCQSCKTGMASL